MRQKRENLISRLFISILSFEFFFLRETSLSKKKKPFIREKIIKNSFLTESPKKSGKSIFFQLLFELQRFFETKKQQTGSGLLENYWFDLLPTRLFFSLSTLFLCQKFSKGGRGTFFDPFHKLLYGFFLMLKKKNILISCYPHMGSIFSSFSRVFIRKPEQENIKLNFLLENFYREIVKPRVKNQVTLFFFLDQLKCKTPGILGKFIYRLLLKKTNIALVNSGFEFLISVYLPFFKRNTPFNFFFSSKNPNLKISQARELKTTGFLTKKPKYLKTLYLQNNKKKRIYNLQKKGKTLKLFSTAKLVFFWVFNFLWRKNEKSFWIFDRLEKLKNSTHAIGSGVNDPLFEFPRFNYYYVFFFSKGRKRFSRPKFSQKKISKKLFLEIKPTRRFKKKRRLFFTNLNKIILKKKTRGPKDRGSEVFPKVLPEGF